MPEPLKHFLGTSAELRLAPVRFNYLVHGPEHATLTVAIYARQSLPVFWVSKSTENAYFEVGSLQIAPTMGYVDPEHENQS